MAQGLLFIGRAINFLEVIALMLCGQKTGLGLIEFRLILSGVGDRAYWRIRVAGRTLMGDWGRSHQSAAQGVGATPHACLYSQTPSPAHTKNINTTSQTNQQTQRRNYAFIQKQTIRSAIIKRQTPPNSEWHKHPIKTHLTRHIASLEIIRGE